MKRRVGPRRAPVGKRRLSAYTFLERLFERCFQFRRGLLIADRECLLGMPTENFVRQVRYLKEHYRIASLPEALAMLEQGEVEQPTVVLTFDDGYAENFLSLRAVAEAEDVPVAVFVCTRPRGRQLPLRLLGARRRQLRPARARRTAQAGAPAAVPHRAGAVAPVRP